MSLPFLAGVFAMTMGIGWTSLYRAESAVQVRRQVFQQRPTKKPTDGMQEIESRKTVPLSMLYSALDVKLLPGGAFYGKYEKDGRLTAGLGRFTAESRAAVLTNTWDHRSSDAMAFTGPGPHIAVLLPIAPEILLTTFNLTSIGNLAKFNRFDDLIGGSEELADARRQSDAAQGSAEKEKEKAREEHEKEVERLEKDKKAAEERRDAHLGEAERLEEDKRELDSTISELQEKYDKQDPKDPALLAEIQQKQATSQQLGVDANNERRWAEEDDREADRIGGQIDHAEATLESGQRRSEEDFPGIG